MRFRIVSVGRWGRRSPEFLLFDQYACRLPLGHLELVEVANQKTLEAEGSAMQRHIAPTDYCIAMDERGEDISTLELADHLARNTAGFKRCVFLIGGAIGLDAGLRASAHYALRIGRLTWPHFLVRGLLAEQVYRLHQLSIGHPYHKA